MRTLGLIVALLLAGCPDDEPYDPAAACKKMCEPKDVMALQVEGSDVNSSFRGRGFHCSCRAQ